MTPKVAVLTPLFGHAQYIGAMLESLQAQTFQDWECHVVIDGEDQAAYDAVFVHAEHDHRISATMLDKRVGLPAARNRAVRETTAPWLLPFDADDLMDPTLLEELLAVGEAMPEKGAVVFTPARMAFPDGTTTVFRYPPFNPATFADVLQLTGAALRRRSLWETLGGWDEAWTKGAEDWHFYARAVRQGLLVPRQLPQPLWTYRQHDGPRNSNVGRAHWGQLQPKLREALTV